MCHQIHHFQIRVQRCKKQRFSCQKEKKNMACCQQYIGYSTDIRRICYCESLRNMSVDLNDSFKYKYDLLKNVSRLVDQPCPEGKSYLARGDFSYFHYSCDDVNDVVRI